MRMGRWIYAMPKRWRALFRRQAAEAELDEELHFHLARQIELQIAKGMQPEQARATAIRALGNTSLTKEEVRDTWGWSTLSCAAQDVRHGLRVLMKSPGFAAIAVFTLALGIAASTSVFTVVDSVVLRPLSYADSGSLVALWERVAFVGQEALGPNPRHVDVWRKHKSSFRDIALLRHGMMGLSLGDHPQVVGTVLTSANLFEVLMATPLLGRTFLAEDEVPGRDNVVILSFNTWQTLFQGDPNVVGTSVRLGDIPRKVIGVMPKTFHFPNRNALPAFPSKQATADVPEPSIFAPLVPNLSDFSWNGEYGNWIALARLKAGVSVDQAQAELRTVQEQVLQQIPPRQRNLVKEAIVPVVQPMQEAMIGRSRRILWFLMAAVAALMLMSCVNLANAQLARTFVRQREAGVRCALGAPKWRLVWHSLAENLLLTAAAAILGILLAAAGVEIFRRQGSVDLPRLSEVRLNSTALLFSIMLTLLSTVLVSVFPALHLLRSDPQSALQQSHQRALGSIQRRSLRTWLVGLQVFVCTVLLLATGLFSRNLLRLLNQEIGFETDEVAFAQVNVSPPLYNSPQTRAALIGSVLGDVRATPGVKAGGFISAVPLEGETWIEGLRQSDKQPAKDLLVNLRWASPGYFETLRHKLIAGRFLEERDREPKGAVITEGVARSLWPGESAVGARIDMQGRKFTIVGVVGDARTASLKTPPPKVAYVHYADRPPSQMVFLARGQQPAEILASELRQAIWRQAPSAAIVRAKTLDGHLQESLGAESFQTTLITTFGVAALLIAMLGIYGVLSYSVATRKQEIGLRMAVGATRRRIYRLTIGEVGAPVLAGLALGLTTMLAGSRVIGGLLHGTQSLDPAVIASVMALFLFCSTLAAYLPARRAASVDPINALRSD